jgi:hypothetical protein
MGMGFREISDATLEFIECVGVNEAHLVNGWAGEMEMRVLEPRNNEAPVKIDDSGVGYGEFLDVGICADCDEFVACDGERFGGGMCVVACPDCPVEEDAVDVVRGEGVREEESEDAKQTFHGCFVSTDSAALYTGPACRPRRDSGRGVASRRTDVRG